MSPFWTKKILVLVLVALGIDSAMSASIDELRHGDCKFQPKEPVGNATFVPSDYDSAGVFLESFIERKRDNVKSYLPLKLQKVVQIGDPSREIAILELVTDCATISLDLIVSVQESEYEGSTIQAVVIYESEKHIITEPFVSFKRFIKNRKPGYSMTWGDLIFSTPDFVYTIHFKQFGFIMSSSDVAYKYIHKIRNEVGFRGNWI